MEIKETLFPPMLSLIIYCPTTQDPFATRQRQNEPHSINMVVVMFRDSTMPNMGSALPAMHLNCMRLDWADREHASLPSSFFIPGSGVKNYGNRREGYICSSRVVISFAEPVYEFEKLYLT
ncbi:hypothetical protein AVEN_215936-1 [Araneus ventricosus]|uniref:Uncharacterized protein n=1 Tax=Araneus ventricosus TaxID=182803 RepID=A0A4Y2HH26_ARAVE|nr:hypothetical protein AVEN_215936-1 [Araneus ventricosus]